MSIPVRILISVCAAAALCLAGCPAQGVMADGGKAGIALKSLSVKFDGEELVNFASAVMNYNVFAMDQTGGGKLQVSASVAGGETVQIIVNGAEACAAAGAAQTECDPPNTANNMSPAAIIVRAYKGDAPPIEPTGYDYTVIVRPKQGVLENDSALQSLYVGYDADSGSKLSPAFGGMNDAYQMRCEAGELSGYVEAVSLSALAAVEISYGSENEGFTPLASGTGAGSGTFALPQADSGAPKQLKIKVTAASGNKFSKTYTVDVAGYQTQYVTYSGTAAVDSAVYEQAGGLDIIAVTAVRAGVRRGAALVESTVIENSFTWSVTVESGWVPAGFTVTLLKMDEETAVESVMFPLSDPSIKEGIALNITDIFSLGNRIYDAQQFFYYLNNSNYNRQNFSLANNIDLSEYKDANGNPVDWTGPSGFSGKLFGNGHAIKLKLSKTKDQTALFLRLGSGAHIENFTLEVSTKGTSPLNMTGANYFGGVIGYISDVSNITIDRVKVKGSLNIGNTNGFLLIGGLIGEIKKVSNMNITNCTSDMNINFNGKNTTVTGIGGLIGRLRRDTNDTTTVNISKCYTMGTISLQANYSNTNSGIIKDRALFAGGLIGDISNSNNGTTKVKIDQCYSYADVSITNGVTSSYYTAGAGGLIGLIWKEGGTTNVEISNSAAIGEKVLLSTPTGTQHSNERIAGVGGASGTSGFLSNCAPNVLTLNNNIARKGMLLGTPPNGAADDTGTDTNGSTSAGKAVEADDFKNTATWTALGWSETDWDFSGLSQGKWPTLK
jgi:hypothetical protein